MHVISAILLSLGLDINDYNLSYSTILNARNKFRKEIVEKIKHEMQLPRCLIVHWDGKLLPTEFSKKKVERLPIAFTGVNTNQLLAAPLVYEATGISEAEVVFEVLNEWNIVDRIKGMCFDTPAVNTGIKNGACTLLMRKLRKDLLHLAWRHNIYEIILRNVVEVAWPITSGPNVMIFKRLQDYWDKIDTSQYDIGIDDAEMKNVLNTSKNEKVSFIESQLKNHQPRDDYRELLTLSYIFLSGIPNGIKFRAPGANHHARWLSKALYCLKIYMFRNQFEISKTDVKTLREICVFLILFYIERWFTAPDTTQAPYGDFKLFQNLLACKTIHPRIALAALKKLSLYFWYFHEHLAVLALFDPSVLREQKLKMIESVKTKDSAKLSEKRITVKNK